MPTPLTVLLQADTKDLEAGLAKASGGFEVFGQKVSGGMMIAGAGVAAGAAVAIGAIADWTTAAAEDRAEQDKLIAAYGRLGVSQDAATESINAAIDAGAAKAFSDSEVRAGLDSLIIATGNADEANHLLAVSQDVARAAGVSLEVASAAVAKAHAGQDAALRKLFPGMEKQASAADTITEATRLSTGAADEYAKSAEGMGKQGSDAFGELTESIGSVFLPIMDAVVPALLPVIQLLAELIKELLPLLKPVIDIAVGGLKLFIEALTTVLGWIKQVIDAVRSVIDWISKMVDIARGAVSAVQGAIDAVNPFAVSTGGVPAMAELGAQAFGARTSGGSGGGGGTTVTVRVMSADPTEVVRALRRWGAANGGSGPLLRGMDRQTGA